MRNGRSSFGALCTALVGTAAIVLSCVREADVPLRIGIAPWPPYELLYLAQENGFLGDESANVHIVELPTQHDVRHAYERGQLDGILATQIELLLLRERRDLAPVVSYVLDHSTGGDVILANGVSTLAGLRGRRIGIEPGSPGILLLLRALASAGVAVHDVQRIPLDPHRMSEAIASGAVDAVVSYPPFSTPIERTGARRLFSSAQASDAISDLLILEKEVVRSRTADAAGLVRAIERAIRWRAEHLDEAHAVMARREGVAASEVAQVLANEIQLVPFETQTSLLEADGRVAQALRDAERLLREAGLLRGAVRDDSAVTARVVVEAGRG